MTCLHCERPDVPVHRRGLCQRCWKNRGIRCHYPTLPTFVETETDTDLDALIAERMAGPLPAWWATASRQARAPR